MKILLFATNHNVQRGSLPEELNDESDRFRSEVSLLVKYHSVDLVAEELSPESLSTSITRCTKSVLQEVAEHLKIQHLYCEPPIAERNATGLSGDLLNAWRESQWLDVMIKKEALTVLFVFGATHLSSFKNLVSKRSIYAVVIHSDWGSS